MKKLTTLFLGALFFCNTVTAQTEFWGTTIFGGTNGLGTVFKTTQDGSGQTVVHNFSTPYPGNAPAGDLMQATNGNFYGFTAEGGNCGYGSMFEYDMTNNFYIERVSFDLHTLGGNPAGHLIQATNGILYGTAPLGGPTGFGTIFSYDIASHAFTILSDYTGTGTGSTPSGSLIQATNGKLYGLGTGGAAGVGAIFEYDIALDSLQVVYSFTTTPFNGYEPWGGLIQATNGKLYGMTAYGGVDDYGTLFEFDIPTATLTKDFDFTNASGRYPYGSLMQASNGLIYGMTNEAGAYSSGTLFEFDPIAITLTPVIDFDDTIGGHPVYGTVCEGSNNKLYGLTSEGGVNYMGTLFEYDPVLQTGTLKYEFTGLDGNYPMGSLILAANDEMYGMTAGGGVEQSGNLFEYDFTSDVLTGVFDMNIAFEGAYPAGGVTLAPNGMLYGIAQHGGGSSMGVIYTIDPVTGTNGVASEFNGSNGGYLTTDWPPGSEISEMCVAANGKLYGMTRRGGSNSDGALFEFDPLSNIITLKASFSSSISGRNPGPGLMQASDGRLYGVTTFGGVNNKGALFAYDITLDSLYTLFDFNTTTGGADCILSELSPGKIYGVAKNGGLNGKGTIFLYDLQTATVTILADPDVTTGHGSGTIFQASNGIFYVLFTQGALNSQGSICSFDTATYQLAKLVDFDGNNGSSLALSGHFQEINGKLYATHAIAGPDYKGILFEFDLATNTLSDQLIFECTNGYRPSTSTLTAINKESESQVWPGDCNYDLIANNMDFLNIGLAYGFAGAPRAGGNTSWTGQPCPSWSGSFNTTVNHKHADANGDGNVNIADTSAINLNYGLTHPFRLSLPEPALQGEDITLLATAPAIAPGQGIDFDIILSYISPAVDSLYGIAFTLTFDPQLVLSSQTSLTWSPSVLGTQGTDMEVFTKYFPATGRIEIAVTRINHTNAINVSGVIGRLHLVASASVSAVTPLLVTPSDMFGITAGENEHQFTPVTGSTLIDPALIGLPELANGPGVTVYPNPGVEAVTVGISNAVKGTSYFIYLYDPKGKCVYTSLMSQTSFSLDVSAWDAGIYSGMVISDDQKQIRNFRLGVIK